MRYIIGFLLIVFFHNCSIFQKEEKDDTNTLAALWLLSLNTDPLARVWSRTSKEKVSYTYKTLNTTGSSESPYTLDNFIYGSASNITWYTSTTETAISSSTCTTKLTAGTVTSSTLKMTVSSVTNCSSSFPLSAGNTFDLTYTIGSSGLTLSADSSTNSSSYSVYGLSGLQVNLSSMIWSFK
ncbi:MAG: hypothetical protein KDK36_19895 [Leptospiraceae bacterium]|nr:hypothetical protein [Leptospiraceae bacterium]